MQTVRLVGNIAQFGEVWETECANVRDIFRLINCQCSGFKKYLVEADKAGVAYEIRKGKDILKEPEDLLLSTVPDEEIIIVEVPDGAKKALKLIAGIILIVVGAVTGQAWLVSIGVNLAVAGITELLAPGPETEDSENEAYLFNGPVNNIKQGIPVPVLYGELIVGGGAISAFYSNAPVNIKGDVVVENQTTTSSGNAPINFNASESASVPVTENSGSNSTSLSEDTTMPAEKKQRDRFVVGRRV